MNYQRQNYMKYSKQIKKLKLNLDSYYDVKIKDIIIVDRWTTIETSYLFLLRNKIIFSNKYEASIFDFYY